MLIYWIICSCVEKTREQCSVLLLYHTVRYCTLATIYYYIIRYSNFLKRINITFFSLQPHRHNLPVLPPQLQPVAPHLLATKLQAALLQYTL